jgi:hypothetical protein
MSWGKGGEDVGRRDLVRSVIPVFESMLRYMLHDWSVLFCCDGWNAYSKV